MARPRRNENTREILIEKGIEMLSDQGYHATGLKQILDSVNVPKGSFYNYFDSKEQYTAEIIKAYTVYLTEQFDAYLKSIEGQPMGLIRNFYEFMIQSYEAEGYHRGCLIGNMAAEIATSSEVCREAMSFALDEWKSRILNIIEVGQAQGRFRSDVSANDLADVLWCTWEGGVLRMKIDGNADNLRKSLNLLLDNLFKPN